MAMGKRKRGRQDPIWTETEDLAKGPGHPFYRALNQLLEKKGFDAFVEKLCREFYAEKLGRPSLPPAVYFRSLLVGFFEGIDSERGIAWRIADSLTLRGFLGYELTEATPDHSTISRSRRLISLEAHEEVFQWVLQVLADQGLLKGKTLGVDATTLEANAAMRSIVRRESGESYEEFLTGLAKAAGIETPTREDLARLDRKRKKKGSNDDWKNPHDPDAKITKMKDGRTHFAYRAEQVTDLETSAIVAVKIGPANEGDTASIVDSMARAQRGILNVLEHGAGHRHLRDRLCAEVVADKGYHSNEVLLAHAEAGIRTYISEPKRGRRRWAGKEAEKAAVYGNHRRVRQARGKQLLRLRGERLERSIAHVYDTGGLRRLYVRGTDNVAKRASVAAAGYDLSLVMRKLFGIGKPRCMQGLVAALAALLTVAGRLLRPFNGLGRPIRAIALLVWSAPHLTAREPELLKDHVTPGFATGC